MGPADTSKTVLFIDDEADINLGDEVTNDTTGEKFVVVQPPVLFQNPCTFKNDHQQVIMNRLPLQ